MFHSHRWSDISEKNLIAWFLDCYQFCGTKLCTYAENRVWCGKFNVTKLPRKYIFLPKRLALCIPRCTRYRCVLINIYILDYGFEWGVCVLLHAWCTYQTLGRVILAEDRICDHWSTTSLLPVAHLSDAFFYVHGVKILVHTNLLNDF